MGELIESLRDASAERLEEIAERYRRADRELHAILFGDDEYTFGLVKGEERRETVSTKLRRMRQAFAAAVEAVEEPRAAKAQAVPSKPRRARVSSGRKTSRRRKRGRAKRTVASSK